MISIPLMRHWADFPVIDGFYLPVAMYVFSRHQFQPFQANNAKDMDKQSLGYAAVFGLQTDLKLQSWQYSWTSSIFFLGMLQDFIHKSSFICSWSVLLTQNRQDNLFPNIHTST